MAATQVGFVTPGTTMAQATEYARSSTDAGPVGTPVIVMRAGLPGVTSKRCVTVVEPVTVISRQRTSVGTVMRAKVICVSGSSLAGGVLQPAATSVKSAKK